MSACRVEQEELAHDIKIMNINSSIRSIKCLECKEEKPAEEMRFIFDWVEEGCCDDCAMDDDVKTEWGIE